jgi:hypothetical protein
MFGKYVDTYLPINNVGRYLPITLINIFLFHLAFSLFGEVDLVSQ